MMNKLKGFVIDGITYFVNEGQIEQAGTVEKAARKLHEVKHPPKKEVKTVENKWVKPE